MTSLSHVAPLFSRPYVNTSHICRPVELRLAKMVLNDHSVERRIAVCGVTTADCRHPTKLLLTCYLCFQGWHGGCLG